MSEILNTNSQENEIEISYIISIIKKKFVFFIITFLMFFGLFLALIFSQPKEYFSSFPVTINKHASKYVISDLRASAKFSKKELVANLYFSEETIENLNFIQVARVNDNDTVFRSSLKINISSKSPESIKIVLDKLMKWSVSNPKLVELLKRKETSIRELIKKTEEQALLKNKLNEELIDLKDVIINSNQIFVPLEPINKSKTVSVFLSFIGAFLLAMLAVLIFNKKD